MTDIPEAAKVRACELANTVAQVANRDGFALVTHTDWERAFPGALARFIAEVSDRVNYAKLVLAEDIFRALNMADLILPDEPDALVEALEATGDNEAKDRAWRLRAQLSERGLKIVKDES